MEGVGKQWLVHKPLEGVDFESIGIGLTRGRSLKPVARCTSLLRR